MSEVSPFDCADVTFTHGRPECERVSRGAASLQKPSKADGVIGQLSMANIGDKVIIGLQNYAGTVRYCFNANPQAGYHLITSVNLLLNVSIG